MRTISVLTGSIALALAAVTAAPAASDGKALYGSKCAACHGQDGVPKKMGAGSKAFGDPEFKTAATVEAIERVTATIHAMDEQVEGIAAAAAGGTGGISGLSQMAEELRIELERLVKSEV